MPLELRHLRTIEALAAFGSLSAAASRLHLTQSALSHQLGALEEEFGVDLVERGPNGLTLTTAGARLLQLAREVLPLLRQAQEELKRMAGGGERLRIAVECHTCFDWLTPAMDTFRDSWPTVEMDLVSGFQQDPLPLVMGGTADLAVLSAPELPHPQVRYHGLFHYEVVGLVNRRHPLAAQDWLRPEDFAEETLITYPVEDRHLDLLRDFLLPAGVLPWRRRHAELTVAILQLVASGQGVAALPAWAVGNYVDKGYVRALPLGPQGLWQTLHAATTVEQAGRPHMMAFLGTVRDLARGMAGLRPLEEHSHPEAEDA